MGRQSWASFRAEMERRAEECDQILARIRTRDAAQRQPVDGFRALVDVSREHGPNIGPGVAILYSAYRAGPAGTFNRQAVRDLKAYLDAAWAEGGWDK